MTRETSRREGGGSDSSPEGVFFPFQRVALDGTLDVDVCGVRRSRRRRAEPWRVVVGALLAIDQRGVSGHGQVGGLPA